MNNKERIAKLVASGEAAAKALNELIDATQRKRLKLEHLAKHRWRVLDQNDFGHLFTNRDAARAFLRALKKGPQ